MEQFIEFVKVLDLAQNEVEIQDMVSIGFFRWFLGNGPKIGLKLLQIFLVKLMIDDFGIS